MKITFKERIDNIDKTIQNRQDRQSFLYDSNGEPWQKTNRVSQDKNFPVNNDQQEDSASKFDLTTEHQNRPNRLSPSTDERQTSIQQYLETDKSNSHNDTNDGDIPSIRQ